MRGAVVESGSPIALPIALVSGCEAWLAVAPRERERRQASSRPRGGGRRTERMLTEPCIDPAACADWMAAAPARDWREVGR